MKIEQQVCSLELAKRLKELGTPQDSLYVWQKGYFIMDDSVLEETDYWRITSNPKNILRAAVVKPYDTALRKLEDDSVSAFTVAELGEMLPHRNKKMSTVNDAWIRIWKTPSYWHIDYEDEDTHESVIKQICETNEADARAKMFIYLLENKLITL